MIGLLSAIAITTSASTAPSSARPPIDRRIADWLANGRQTAAPGLDLTIAELMLAYPNCVPVSVPRSRRCVGRTVLALGEIPSCVPAHRQRRGCPHTFACDATPVWIKLMPFLNGFPALAHRAGGAGKASLAGGRKRQSAW
jgi:hypothetical protein